MTDNILLRPGTLWPALQARTRHALDCGAMQPIGTEQHFIEDGGVRFVLRQVSSLQRKAEDRAARAAGGRPADPFLPPEPHLVVAEVSDDHLAVLNKFNVMPYHLLIVTRRFVHQEILPDAADFAALAACLREFDSLGFYNGGREAGASQDHKHLQLVALPLASDGPAIPMEAALRTDARDPRAAGPPFPHAFRPLDPARFDDPAAAGPALAAVFLELLSIAGLRGVPEAQGLRQCAPYNLLVTRRWMLLVPRAHECFGGVSVNALGFAGSLFVRDAAQREAVRDAGPMRVLMEVAGG